MGKKAKKAINMLDFKGLKRYGMSFAMNCLYSEKRANLVKNKQIKESV